jgi:hypothetical protein
MPSRDRPVNTTLAVGIVIVLGATLVYLASRATSHVEEGARFVRWMLVVFACFLVLASLPIILSY